MGLLNKLFGGATGLKKIERYLAQGAYAEALHSGEDLLAQGDMSDELERLMVAAGDGLAALNLDEGQRFFQAAALERGTEHLLLAQKQARSEDLLAQIDAVLSQGVHVDSTSPPPAESLPAAEDSGCGSCAPAPRVATVSYADLPDQQARVDLILAAYPAEVQARYLDKSPDFTQAFLLVHEGDDEQALELLKKLPEAERDGLYLFELGSLYARLGDHEKGLGLLEQALDLEPGNLLLIDALVSLMVGRDETVRVRDLLTRQMELGADPAFCQARLCELQAQAQNFSVALDLARKALDAGYAESEFLVLAAWLFEQSGDDAEAERLLSALPGGGCSGGINLPLAEFWLRQKRELGRVLDAFNDACRREPDNPQWQLRVAQTYLARKWRKQGLDILQRVVNDPRLEESLRLEAEQLLAES